MEKVEISYDQETDLVIFPNPVDELVTVSSKEIIDQLEIYDTDLKQITKFNPDDNIFSFSMEKYPSGVYLVKAIMGINTAVLRITLVK